MMESSIFSNIGIDNLAGASIVSFATRTGAQAQVYFTFGSWIWKNHYIDADNTGAGPGKILSIKLIINRFNTVLVHHHQCVDSGLQ
jgi:hypothetical protein